MITYLITISLLLHVIFFGIIFFLFHQLKSLKRVQTKEFTDLFDRYLRDIKSENLRLENKIIKKSDYPKVSIKENKEKLISNGQEKDIYDEQVQKISDRYEPTLEAKVLQLYHEGHKIEDIAKQLNCGVTEIALIAKFSGEN